jgi:hypothetical protein
MLNRLISLFNVPKKAALVLCIACNLVAIVCVLNYPWECIGGFLWLMGLWYGAEFAWKWYRDYQLNAQTPVQPPMTMTPPPANNNLFIPDRLD